MKSLPIFLALLMILNLSPMPVAQSQLPYRDPRLPVDQRVADLLRRMTLEEKIAQTQSMWVNNQWKLLADENGNFAPDQKTRELLKLGLGQMSGASQGAIVHEVAAAHDNGRCV